jgi:WD40 repeat protein
VLLLITIAVMSSSLNMSPLLTENVESINLENAAELTQIEEYQETEHYFSDIQFHSDGELLAVIRVDNKSSRVHDGVIMFLQTDSLEKTAVLDFPLRGLSLDFDTSGQQLAVGSQTGLLTFVDMSSREKVLEKQIDDAELDDIAFDPTGQFVAMTIGTITTVRENEYAFMVLDASSEMTVFTHQVGDNGSDGKYVVFPSKSQVVFTTTDDTVYVVDLSENKIISEILNDRGDVQGLLEIPALDNFAYLKPDTLPSYRRKAR